MLLLSIARLFGRLEVAEAGQGIRLKGWYSELLAARVKSQKTTTVFIRGDNQV